MAPQVSCPMLSVGGVLPIWGEDPIFVMKVTRSQTSLLGQVVAVNVLLVVATLFAASAAANLNLELRDQRSEFALLAFTIILILLVNILMVRRRFSPLEELTDRIEAVDPAQPSTFEAPEGGAGTQEVDRLARSFQMLLGRVEAERRRSGRLVLRAQEEERRRLARDLHDEVNQALTAILLRLEAASQAAPPELEEELGELKRLVNQAMEELLQLARQLRPSALDDHGLVPALEGQVRRFGDQHGIDARLETQGRADSLGDDQQLVVYRVAQEALANVARHSQAHHVEVDLVARASGLDLSVRDDGVGFHSDIRPTGLGLNGMAERARLVGGELNVRSIPGQGTTVTLHVP
jgi:two-component system, NarL family, sensor histidine kinase UhpB